MTAKLKKALKWTWTGVTAAAALLLLMSAWGGLVPPARGWFFPMLTLAMPVTLAVALAVLALTLLLRQWRLALVPVAALLLSWPSLRNYTPLNVVNTHPAVNAADSLQFTVLTINVNNFGRYIPPQFAPPMVKQSLTMRYILDTDADVVLVQELSMEREYRMLLQLQKYMPEFYRKYPYHSDGHRDLAIFSKYPYDVGPDVIVRPVASSVSYVGGGYHYYVKTFDVHMPHRTQRFINVHLQSTGLSDVDKRVFKNVLHGGVTTTTEARAVKHSLFEKLGRAYKQRAVEAGVVRALLDNSPRDVILCGDFNDTPGSYVYRTIKGGDMDDAYTQCALGPTYTFSSNKMYFKIDHILYRGDLEPLAIRRDTGVDSDHFPLLATFRFTR